MKKPLFIIALLILITYLFTIALAKEYAFKKINGKPYVLVNGSPIPMPKEFQIPTPKPSASP